MLEGKIQQQVAIDTIPDEECLANRPKATTSCQLTSMSRESSRANASKDAGVPVNANMRVNTGKPESISDDVVAYPSEKRVMFVPAGAAPTGMRELAGELEIHRKLIVTTFQDLALQQELIVQKILDALHAHLGTATEQHNVRSSDVDLQFKRESCLVPTYSSASEAQAEHFAGRQTKNLDRKTYLIHSASSATTFSASTEGVRMPIVSSASEVQARRLAGGGKAKQDGRKQFIHSDTPLGSRDMGKMVELLPMGRLSAAVSRRAVQFNKIREEHLKPFWQQRQKAAQYDSGVFSFVRSWAFEMVSAMAIVLNAIVLAIASDHARRNLNKPPLWIAEVCEIGFTVFYALELSLRVGAYRMYFFACDDWQWHIFDLALVSTALYDLILSQSGENVTNMTTIRLMKLMKLMRLVRMVRILRTFRDLRLLLQSILSAMKPMCWSVVLILIVAYIFGICFLQGTTSFLETAPPQDTDKIVRALDKYWGSVGTSVVSLYMASTGGESWTVMAQPLRQVGTGYFVLFLLYIAFFMFVVANALTSLYIESTMRNAEKDHQSLINEELSKKSEYIRKIVKLFKSIDVDQSGDISLDEFLEHLKNPDLSAFSSSLGIDLFDTEQFFRMLSINGQRRVDIDTFTVGCMKMKGSARSMDLFALSHQQRQAMKDHEAFMTYCTEQFALIHQALVRTQRCVVRGKGQPSSSCCDLQGDFQFDLEANQT